ncbi:YciI family protein [Janthinobacterium sp. 17J80-10]|uniref:YciI family protein n=1 Tax=Janthinobacterium sp. 17J80-10 TaxID=2497863 RepID=UPI0010055C7D|nr:YciI family protein [Janthinobacterium sp. 17J80-10]QAU33000.1 hypothetical protein EKL02_01770 [Janthinobacterium sp. 17J80-10]
MQFLIFLYDATDAGAQERRARIRPDHLKRAEHFQHANHLLIGGALLNDAGDVIGSAAAIQFDTRAELDEWFNTDPYKLGNVWARMEVHNFRVAPHYNIQPIIKETH